MQGVDTGTAQIPATIAYRSIGLELKAIVVDMIMIGGPWRSL